MNFLCKLFGCEPDCEEAVLWQQRDCERRLSEVHREHEAEYKKLRKIKDRWEDGALEWERKYLNMRDLRDAWKEKHQGCRDELNAKPKPSKAIKSLAIQDGKFIINGRETRLFGASKREMICASAGVISNLSYNHRWVKKLILASNTNYIRVFAPKDLAFFRNEVIEYLEAGKVVEVELWDAGNPHRAYAAYWLDIFNAVKDLPVIFDAHNEFADYDGVSKAHEIVSHVVAHGGLISAGAWGSSTHGKESANDFKMLTNKYQIVSHHRQWTKASILADKEPGKPLILNELHSRDVSLQQMKDMVTAFSKLDVQGVQIYSLGNWDANNGENFKKILDYMGGLVK